MKRGLRQDAAGDNAFAISAASVLMVDRGGLFHWAIKNAIGRLCDFLFGAKRPNVRYEA